MINHRAGRSAVRKEHLDQSRDGFNRPSGVAGGWRDLASIRLPITNSASVWFCKDNFLFDGLSLKYFLRASARHARAIVEASRIAHCEEFV